MERFYRLLNQGIPWLIGIFLFFNPFPHTTAIREISFYICLLIFLVLFFAKKEAFSFRAPLSFPFALFAIWSCVGLLFALNKGNSFHDVYAHLLKYLFFFYLVFHSFRSTRQFHILVRIFIVSTSVFFVILMVNDYAILNRPLTEKLGYNFPESSPNIIGIHALFSLLLAIAFVAREVSLYEKTFLAVSIGLSTFTALATQARSAVIALFFAAIVIFPKRKKIMISFFILAIILLVGFMPSMKARLSPDSVLAKIKGDDRVNIWLCHAEIVKDYPIFGVGFGMQTFYDGELLREYNAKVPERYQMTHLYNAPHNILVDTATRTGLVGLALFLYILFSFLKMGWRLVRNGKNEFIRDWSLFIMGTFVAIFIQGMFENTLSGPPAIILYAIFAMMTILWRMQHDPPEEPRDGVSAP